MNVKIRFARQEEGETLAAIEARCFPPAEAASREAILERIAAFPENFLVAENEEGILTGFINGGTTDQPYLPDAFYHDVRLHKKEGAYQTVFGLNVLPEYRRQGIAAALTSNLAVEILEREKVPFYCCAWSNIPSARNAVKSGFMPTWVEMTVKPMGIVEEMNR